MDSVMLIDLAISFSLGYILGSIPFGLVLVYLVTSQDIRTIGSGNIGATNVLRSGHKELAFLTLILDALKGAIAFFMVCLWLPPESAAIAGFGAVVGHCFPVWLRFAGGKGVATGMAVITVVVPFTGLIMAATWLLVAVFTRISSLSSLVSFVAAGLFVSVGPFENSGMAQITVWGVGLLSWARHKQNIQRILSGGESKISFRKKPSD
ncbi:MAG: glycerol-3-phosphate 1-O-acyltransferase PlsY [Candidatus Puniceispirillaceae bacterium]